VAGKRTRLELEEGLPYEGWTEVGDLLRDPGGGQAVDEQRAAKWMHYAWVCRSVEICLRKQILTYKHLPDSQQHDDYADVIAAQVIHAYLHLTDLERGPLPRRARTCRGLLQAGTGGASGSCGLRAALA